MTVTDEQPDAATATPDVQPDAEPDTTTEPAEDADTFPREYVEKLRRESAGYRDNNNELSKRLHAALVAATGRLADPTDLPYSVEHLKSTETLTGAIDALLEAKPHLKARRIAGSVGQGNQGGTNSAPTSFADLLR